MKKVLGMIVFLAAILLTSCSVAEGVADLMGQSSVSTSGLGTEMVKMFRASSFIHSRNGMTQYTRSFEIRVKNVSYEKVVGVHHHMLDGNWTNLAARYVRPADNGYEIWSVSVYSLNTNNFQPEFAVYYTVNGRTYWDNNGGADYSLMVGDGVLLGQGVAVLQAYASYNNEIASFSIDLQNLAYIKTVEIVYTTDNWASSTVIPAGFDSYYFYGYAFLQSPNRAGVERWSARANVLISTPIKYFIKYTVNGREYFDNNFGADYKLF